MKKLITSIFTLLVFAISFSQISYGVKAGYSNSSMKWNEGNIKTKFDSKSYFYFGGFVENKISEKVTLQGELQYTELGGEITQVMPVLHVDDVINDIYTIRYVIPQLSLPISSKFYATENFRILGGLNLNFLISPKVEETFKYSTENNKEGNYQGLKSFNINPFLGAEYQFYKNIFAEARYNFGLFDAAKSDAINTYFKTFQIGFGYKF